MARAGILFAFSLALLVCSGFRSVPELRAWPYAKGGFRVEGIDPFEGDRLSPIIRSLYAESEVTPIDSSLHPRVLMLNYCSYDSAYANKVLRIIHRQIPGAHCFDFWDGSPEQLAAQLVEKDVVVVVYPSGGEVSRIEAYGETLRQFVQKGGEVIFTGTHYFRILQGFGLLEPNKGYFCKEPVVDLVGADNFLLNGIPASFSLANYAYPLDLDDPDFQSVAEVQGYPVLGTKALGNGKIVYLGLEYYYDENISSRILVNAILAALPKAESEPPVEAAEEVPESGQFHQHATEFLYAGTGAERRMPAELKIYPNPYMYKATLEVEIREVSTVGIDVTDEQGRQVSTLLPRKSLNPGFYRFDLPNVAPGIYFLRYTQNDQNMVRKLVKVEAP